MMIKDSEAIDKLVPALIALSKDEQKQTELKNNIATYAVQDADERIAKEILKSIG
jgi:UDP-N-acetylglucosamine--N-acetylmuramyl-(pentapeptide) pyrophosphoryl-undecaprenol N-acetylglucosamine transferase